MNNPTPLLPTKWEQLQLLAGVLVAAGDASSRLFNTESINYYMDKVLCREDKDPDHRLHEYPRISYMCPTVCNHCGRIAGAVGGRIVESCHSCEFRGGAIRWRFQAELIEFKTNQRIHRRWAEMALAQAIAARTINYWKGKNNVLNSEATTDN